MIRLTTQQSDTELLAAWRAGDKRAGGVLCARHHQSLIRFFSHKLDGDTTDLIQDTFLGLLEGLERFRGEASIRTMLFAIARNKLYNHLRNLNRTRGRFDPGTVSLADLGTSPTGKLMASDRRQRLLHALCVLPIDTQIMFELHYWEDLQLNEIAVIFGVAPGTLRQRLRRARATLEQLIEHSATPEAALSLTRLSEWARRVEAEALERHPLNRIDATADHQPK